MAIICIHRRADIWSNCDCELIISRSQKYTQSTAFAMLYCVFCVCILLPLNWSPYSSSTVPPSTIVRSLQSTRCSVWNRAHGTVVIARAHCAAYVGVAHKRRHTKRASVLSATSVVTGIVKRRRAWHNRRYNSDCLHVAYCLRSPPATRLAKFRRVASEMKEATRMGLVVCTECARANASQMNTQ